MTKPTRPTFIFSCIILVCAILVVPLSENRSGSVVTVEQPATDWMAGQFGLGFHYLPEMYGIDPSNGSAAWNAAVNSFNVDQFADAAQSAGAKWVQFTLGHASGYYIAPNATLDQFSGYAAGERNSTRDLMMDLADALNKRGLKLIVYLPSNAPKADAKIAHGLGLTTKSEINGNWQINPTFVQRWTQVIQEWADRYGTKVSAWWFDGFYVDNGFTPELGADYVRAVQHGNPQALVAFNPGANEWLSAASPYQDYLAGEQTKNLYTDTTGRWVLGPNTTRPVQWQAYNILGEDWTLGGLSHTDEEVKAYMKTTLGNGGAITWNLYTSATGTIDQTEVDQLKRVD